MARTTHLLALVLALSGCSNAVPASTDDDDRADDGVVSLTTASEIGDELAASPVHDAIEPFARVVILYDVPASGTDGVEVSTSVDGASWTEYARGTLDPEASDAADGTWVANVDVGGDPARYWRARAAGLAAAPTFLAIATRTEEDLVAEATPDDAPPGELAVSGDVAGTSEALTSFRQYAFDDAKVGRAWLWLLRACRAHGWHGHLSGPRTGLRTYAQQLSLWNAYQHGTGAPAFPPWGPSRHMIRNVQRVGTWYQAVDTDDVAHLISIAHGLGVVLHVPYAREPWHVEAVRAFGPPRGWEDPLGPGTVRTMATISYAPNSFVIGNAFPGWTDHTEGSPQFSRGAGNPSGDWYQWGFLFGEGFDHCAFISAGAVGSGGATGSGCGARQEIDSPMFHATYTNGMHNDLLGDGSLTHMDHAGPGCTDTNGYANVEPWRVPATPHNPLGTIADGKPLRWRYVSKDGHWVLVRDPASAGLATNWYFVHRGCVSLANRY